jgi:hypothetical protein
MRASSLLAVATGIFVCRFVAACYLIPPWQNPDEPTHFGYVWTLAHGPGFELQAAEAEQIERIVLGSMVYFDWWRQYREPVPAPFPSRFLDVPEHITAIGGGAQPVYYVLAAVYLKALPVDSLMGQYAALRVLSMVAAVLTMAVAWAGTRLLFGDLSATVAALVLALHPQFLLVGMTVGPDTLVNLLAAVIWWQSARLLRDRSPVLSLAVMLVSGALIVATKRLGAPVAAAVLVVAGIYVVGQAWRLRGKRVGVLLLMLLAVGLGGVFAVQAFSTQFETLRYSWALFIRSPEQWNPRAFTWDYLLLYTREMFASAWLVAGHLRYSAPTAWFAAVYALTACAVVGLVLHALRSRDVQWTGLLLAGALVLSQLGALYATTYAMAYGAQGRYLFPVVSALTALLWIGVREWCPRGSQKYAAAALVTAMLALDLTGWLTVLIPAYVY